MNHLRLISDSLMTGGSLVIEIAKSTICCLLSIDVPTAAMPTRGSEGSPN